MAICENANLQAIEQFEPSGESVESLKYPFKIKVGPRGHKVVCLGEEWCAGLLKNACPQFIMSDIKK